MKMLVQEEGCHSGDKLLHRIFNAAEQITDNLSILGRTTDALIH
jgi:hypothetical protein